MLTSILAAIGSLATIVGGLVYVFKYSAWALTKTNSQKDAEIDAQIAKEKQDAEVSGRPQ